MQKSLLLKYIHVYIESGQFVIRTIYKYLHARVFHIHLIKLQNVEKNI